MLYKHKKLEDHVEHMRNLGDMLIPYNFPKAPAEWEDDINILKATEMVVDGYTIVVHYSKADYETHYLETLQILGKNAPFLPFVLICKLAKRFLGEHELSLIEVVRDNRKVYCWTLTVDRDGKPIPSPFDQETEPCQYEGFHYSYMKPDQVRFH
jgi:hypothetical protein